MDAFYFGCIRESGHYLWDINHQRVSYYSVPEGFPCLPDILDGGLFPKSKYSPKQGVTYLSYVNGWTILSMADCSVDRRSGSHSIFLLRGEYSFEDALSNARTMFPKIFERFEFEVIAASSARLMSRTLLREVEAQ